MQFSLSTLLSLTPLLLPTLASPITPTSSAATSQPTGAAFGQPFFLQAEVSNTTSFGGLLLLGSYTTPSGENIAALQNHTGIPINYVANVKFSGVSGSETESSIIAYAGDGTLALTLGQYDLVPLNWSAFPGSKGWFLDGQNLFRYEPIPTLQFLVCKNQYKEGEVVNAVTYIQNVNERVPINCVTMDFRAHFSA